MNFFVSFEKIKLMFNANSQLIKQSVTGASVVSSLHFRAYVLSSTFLQLKYSHKP